MLALSFSATPDILRKSLNSFNSGSLLGKASFSPAFFLAARTACTLPRPTYSDLETVDGSSLFLIILWFFFSSFSVSLRRIFLGVLLRRREHDINFWPCCRHGLLSGSVLFLHVADSLHDVWNASYLFDCPALDLRKSITAFLEYDAAFAVPSRALAHWRSVEKLDLARVSSCSSFAVCTQK